MQNNPAGYHSLNGMPPMIMETQ